jgi:PKD repeat protein
MKKIYLFALFIAAIVTTQAQTFGCLAGELSQKQYDKHPELLVIKAQLDSFTREYVKRAKQERQQQGAAQRSAAVYVVPVVFHILHDGGSENLPDSIIFREMIHWNQYVSMTNPELPTTVAAFDTLEGNPQVEFRLAQIDPNGNCTNGIERIYTSTTYDGDDNNKQDPWPPQKYLNVWVVNDMSEANNFAAAYAYYPSAVATYVNNDIIDGIIVLSTYVGSNAAYNRPTLGHESGHWMNLEHVWGNTNSPGVACGDDDVDDTPITKGNSGGCTTSQDGCNPPIIENVQNIMNYSACHFMFTKGQVDRMHAALNSPVSGRDSIWGTNNLIATGTSQPLTYPNPQSCAAPIADFTVSNRYICAGQVVTFTDASWNADIQSRTWTFPADVNLGNSTTADATPSVSFTTPGWKQVTLMVSNANGSSQKVKSMVYVSDGSTIIAPYFEGFEDATESQANWQVINYDNNNTAFTYDNTIGHYSNACYKMNMYNALTDGDRDDLISPTIDMTSVDPSTMTLSFDYSFATYNSAHMSDSIASLSVSASIDCGVSWHRIYFNPGGFNLYNAGAFTTGPYTPGQQDEFWQNVTINIPTPYQTSSVNFKFELLSAKSANQFYIDNINIGQSTAGINTVKVNAVNSMTIVPNPAQGSATLMLMASTNTNATAIMYDMAGREVMTIFSGQLTGGQKNIPFNTENIEDGVYIVKVSDGKTSIQQRFVKM